MEGREAIVAELRRLLGLSSYEARAYLAVLRGTRRPRDVAREAGVPLQRVYDVLARLEERGLVAREAGGFVAVSPREALGAAAERVVAEARARAGEIRRLGEELEALAGGGGAGYVRLASGVVEAAAAALEALGRCGRGGETWVMTLKAVERADQLRPIILSLLERLPRGTRVLVGAEASVPGWLLEEAARRGVEARRSPAVLMDILVACDTAVIGLPSGGDDAVAVVVRNPVFAGGLRRRLESVWGGAEPLG